MRSIFDLRLLLVCVAIVAGNAVVLSSVRAQSAWVYVPTYYAGQGLYMARNMRPGMPGYGTVFYNGVRGYSVSGWELGRMQSTRRYGADPGPWPGWRGAFGW